MSYWSTYLYFCLVLRAHLFEMYQGVYKTVATQARCPRFGNLRSWQTVDIIQRGECWIFNPKFSRNDVEDRYFVFNTSTL